ncbi:hypothetical protein ACSLVQ_31040, partial [Klebsiella pneumoniae]|uniref:hypothetical protein n=1 Tax=Klebsiella pneumoniae TaxID=573 RepID=UPI003EE39745
LQLVLELFVIREGVLGSPEQSVRVANGTLVRQDIAPALLHELEPELRRRPQSLVGELLPVEADVPLLERL